jgi:hypothetical protein
VHTSIFNSTGILYILSMTKLIILIIALLILGISAYFYISERKHEIPQNASQKEELSKVTIPDGWQTYKNDELKFAISYPPGFEATQNGKYSVMIVKKVTEPGQGPYNFVYISVVPEGAQNNDGEIYNFNKTHLDSLLSIKVNEKGTLKGEAPELAEYITFTRLPDTEISGNFAATFINDKPWEFTMGTGEYRYVIDQQNRTYLIGGYISTTSHNSYSIPQDLYEQILRTIQLPPPSERK